MSKQHPFYEVIIITQNPENPENQHCFSIHTRVYEQAHISQTALIDWILSNETYLVNYDNIFSWQEKWFRDLLTRFLMRNNRSWLVETNRETLCISARLQKCAGQAGGQMYLTNGWWTANEAGCANDRAKYSRFWSSNNFWAESRDDRDRARLIRERESEIWGRVMRGAVTWTRWNVH